MMGLLYIFGAFLLFIAIGMVFDRLRLQKLRRQRQGMGFSREEFIDAFRQLAIPDNIPASVYDYYASRKAWKDFPLSPNDDYVKVLGRDDEDLEHEARALVERLGMLFLPEYVRREYGNKPIKTLRDMVLWLDWMHQHQPAATKSGEAQNSSQT